MLASERLFLIVTPVVAENLHNRVRVGAAQDHRIVKDFRIGGILHDDPDVAALRAGAVEEVVADDPARMIGRRVGIHAHGDLVLTVEEDIALDNCVDRSSPRQNGRSGESEAWRRPDVSKDVISNHQFNPERMSTPFL
jgi:hypothetical protein